MLKCEIICKAEFLDALFHIFCKDGDKKTLIQAKDRFSKVCYLLELKVPVGFELS